MERLKEYCEPLRDRIRDLVEDRPWLKWACGVIVLLGLTLIVLQFFRVKPDRALSGDRLAAHVQVRFEDTADSMSVPVGYVTSDLLKLGSALNAASRVTNPKSGQRTGLVIEKGEWDRIIADVTKLVSAGNATP